MSTTAAPAHAQPEATEHVHAEHVAAEHAHAAHTHADKAHAEHAPTEHASHAEHSDHAAREPIPHAHVPEAEHASHDHGAHHERADHPRDAIKPPEAHKKVEHVAKNHDHDPALSAPVAVNNQLVITDALRDTANQQLANFIADKISDAVIDESLRVKLVEDVAHGQPGIKICLSGLKLEGNHALIGKQLEQALRQHPVFAPFYANEQHRPRFIDDAKQPNMVHVHVPNLTLEQYHGVFEALANQPIVAPVVPTVAPMNIPSPGSPIAVPAAANDTQADVVVHTPVAPGGTPREQGDILPVPVAMNDNEGRELQGTIAAAPQIGAVR